MVGGQPELGEQGADRLRTVRLLIGRCFFSGSGRSSAASTQVSYDSPAPQNGRASWYMTSGACCSIRTRFLSRWKRWPSPCSAGSFAASGKRCGDSSAANTWANWPRWAARQYAISTNRASVSQACQGLIRLSKSSVPGTRRSVALVEPEEPYES